MKLKISKKTRLIAGIGSLVTCAVLVIVEVVFVLLPVYSLVGRVDTLGAAEVDRRLDATNALVHVINGVIIALVIFMAILVVEAIVARRKRNGR